MNSTIDIETLDDGDKARLATLAIRLCYGDDDVLPRCIDEQIKRINRLIGTAKRLARRQHWQQNHDFALAAATKYIELQNVGQPLSVAAVAAEFKTSERSVRRVVEQLRMAAEANRKVGPE